MYSKAGKEELVRPKSMLEPDSDEMLNSEGINSLIDEYCEALRKAKNQGLGRTVIG